MLLSSSFIASWGYFPRRRTQIHRISPTATINPTVHYTHPVPWVCGWVFPILRLKNERTTPRVRANRPVAGLPAARSAHLHCAVLPQPPSVVHLKGASSAPPNIRLPSTAIGSNFTTRKKFVTASSPWQWQAFQPVNYQQSFGINFD